MQKQELFCIFINGFENKPFITLIRLNVNILRMAVKQIAAIVTFTVIMCLFTLKMYISNDMTSFPGSQQVALESKDRELQEYIRQRNNISRLLNLKQQKIGQMECEV